MTKDVRENGWPYIYFWDRHDRKGQPCRVTARANVMNSCRVEFPDGYKMITSRNAIRKPKPLPEGPLK